MTTIDPASRWLVVFNDEPHGMRILAAEPATDAEPRTDLWAHCLSSYEVDAAGPAEARRTARQLHDVERIRNARARQRACRDRRRALPAAAPYGPDAIEMASQDLNLTHQCRAYADAMAKAALRAGYEHRPYALRDLTFTQYLDRLPAATHTVLHRYAALATTGHEGEAVALLVNTLAAAVSDL
ncbi:hypothetical protein [Streptomyces sp. NPDC059787]|uniref:hypothetical protein n=1 Tax=Streptomyces sp. NPDC059787 TaxID=3346947 RepID=UPI0036693099